MNKILLILSILSWTATEACICFSHNNFLKVSEQAEIIAIVHVKDYQDYLELDETFNRPLSAVFEVIKILKGKEEKTKIKVFGDDGSLCRPYITNLKKGEYYVIALRKCSERKRSKSISETIEDYFLPGCGEFWFQYNPNNSSVTGLINRKRKSTTMPLKRLESLIKDNSRNGK